MKSSTKTLPKAVKRLFIAIQEGEPEQALELMHTRAEWTPTVWSGEPMYRGHEGVHLWFEQFGENLEYLDIRVKKFEARGDRAAVLGLVFDTRGGQTFVVEVPWSFELEGELLRRGRAHGSWEEALAAAGLAEQASPPAAEAATGEPSAFERACKVLLRDGCPVRRRLVRH
jgi:ketosteroid isomerase-like protein